MYTIDVSVCSMDKKTYVILKLIKVVKLGF